MRDIDPTQIIVAKAARVADHAMHRRNIPANRGDLLDCAAVIRSRIRCGHDAILKALGFSTAGLTHFYVTEYGMSAAEAELMADATAALVQSYRSV